MYIYTNVCKMSSILFRFLCVKNIVLIPNWWPILIFIEAELWLAILVLTATCVAPQKCCRHSGDRRPTSSSCPAYCAPSCHDGHPNCWPLDLAWNPPPVASSGTSSMTRGRSSRSQDFFLDSLMVRHVIVHGLAQNYSNSNALAMSYLSPALSHQCIVIRNTNV